METFSCTITDERGLHARNAMTMCRIAENYCAKIIVKANGREADCKDMIALMNLQAKQNDHISFTAEGEDENAAIQYLRAMIHTLT